MIEFALRAKAESVRDMEHVFDVIERLPGNFILQAGLTAIPIFSRTVSAKFEVEGPDWPELAKSTIRERTELLGPGLGAHPILERFGYLRRSLTDPTYGGPHMVSYPTWSENEGFGEKEVQTGNALESYEIEQGHHLFRWVIFDERFEFLVGEWPMIPLDAEAEAMCEEIEYSLIRLAYAMGGP